MHRKGTHQCITKITIETKELAEKYAERFSGNGVKLRAYEFPCTVCGKYHVTKAPLRGGKKGKK